MLRFILLAFSIVALPVIAACSATATTNDTRSNADTYGMEIPASDEATSSSSDGHDTPGAAFSRARSRVAASIAMRSGPTSTSTTPPAPTTPPPAPTTTTPPAPTTPPPAPTTPAPTTPAPTTPAPTTPPPAPTTPPPAPTTPPPAPALAAYHGVNLSGAEFGSAKPGSYGSDYTFPTSAEVDYFVQKGMNTFRVGFLWERLQPTAQGAFDATYASRLKTIVSYATSKGAKVILNPANFARYYGNVVGSSTVPNAAFADFWRRIALEYAGDANVMYNLVNEPRDMPTEQWVSAANAAIAAIRGAGAKQAVVVPGNGWTGAWSWNDTWYGTSNAVAMKNIVDSANNVIFEVHQYLDANSGGESATCVSTTIGSERLAGFVKWLRDNGKKGMLGEFGAGSNPTCNTAVTNMMSYMKTNADVLVGWLWWSAGPWWDEYMYTLEPTNLGSSGTTSGAVDRPQLALLTPYL